MKIPSSNEKVTPITTYVTGRKIHVPDMKIDLFSGKLSIVNLQLMHILQLHVQAILLMLIINISKLYILRLQTLLFKNL